MRRLTLLFGVICAACGNATPIDFDESVPTQLGPIVTRLAPTAGRGGDTITIFGMGFTSEPAQNTILVGGAATVAASHALRDPPAVGELEQLTFIVPADAAVGATTVTVFVFANGSNSDMTFMVTP